MELLFHTITHSAIELGLTIAVIGCLVYAINLWRKCKCKSKSKKS